LYTGLSDSLPTVLDANDRRQEKVHLTAQALQAVKRMKEAADTIFATTMSRHFDECPESLAGYIQRILNTSVVSPCHTTKGESHEQDCNQKGIPS
jgi:ATP/maltotriose-dependent transcriptional regulator MalT